MYCKRVTSYFPIEYSNPTAPYPVLSSDCGVANRHKIQVIAAAANSDCWRAQEEERGCCVISVDIASTKPVHEPRQIFL